MAMPGEKENKEYMDYVIEVQSNGETPLSKEEWREKLKSASKDKPMQTALSSY